MMTDDLHGQSGTSPAVPVASAVASMSRMSPPHRWSTGRSLRRILAIAACEFRLQRRSPAYWIAAAIVTVVTVGLALLQSPAPGKMTNSATTAVTVCEGAALFASLLLPWLASGAFARDVKRRFSPLLWTRPVAPGEYALGKALAVTTMSLLLGLPSILIGWAAVGIVQGTLQPADLWLGMLPVVATTVSMAAVVALLCLCIAPNPILGALCSTVLLLYFGVVSSQTLLGLPNLVATSVYASPGIGFGPDAPLLTAQRMAYVALALIMCSLFVLSFQARNRHVGLRGGSWYVAIGAVLLTSLIALPLVAHFETIAARYVALGPVPVAPSTATISRYDITATIDPTAGTLSGMAVVRLAPPHDVQLTPGEIYFTLNPGLQVNQISAADAAGLADSIAPTSDGVSGWTKISEVVSFSTSLGWTHANLRNTAYQRGDPVQLTISFGGHWTLSRDAYSSPPPTLSFGPAISPGSDTIFSYIGQGVAFLEGDGRSGWYPLFWTQQTLSTYGARQPFNRVQLRMPATVQVFCPLAGLNRSTDGSWQQLEGHIDGVLPAAFVAALAAPKSVTLNGAAVYFKGDRPSGDTASVQSMALQQARALDTWLVPAAGSSTRHWIGVIVPFIQSPVAGTSMLFLPETPDASGTVAFGTFPSAPDATRYRYVAQEVAEAWWQNAATFSADAPIYLTIPPRGQTLTGSTLLYANPPELLVLLATYSALVLTGNAFGHAVMNTEITARQAYHDRYHSPDPALVLTHLEHQLSSVRVATLLQSFILQYHQTHANTMNFVAAASAAAGRNIEPDAAPYLDSTS